MKRNGNSYKNLLLETKLINPKKEETVYPFLEMLSYLFPARSYLLNLSYLLKMTRFLFF